MPATPSLSINLLGTQDLEHSPQGRIVQWALTYGRYIMIGTEIVVLLAFISRFSLDRKLTDLKEEISQKQAILEANVSFEQDVRNLVGKTTQIQSLLKDESKLADILSLLRTLLPPGVYLESVDINPTEVHGKAIASTTQGFAQFLGSIQSAKNISQVDIGEIHKNPITGIAFDFHAHLVPTKSQITPKK
ncbi:hypothetical protein HY409_02180 [Candidatus Gottesmanbacteria bacterium]|nr:hypothetical protein [Candidatus Gottesmanbacteria bacterium]